VTPRERLEQAIELATLEDPDAFACRFCTCPAIGVADRAGLGPIPDKGHYARTMADSCPSLRGGLHAQLVHEDVWAKIDPFLDLAPAGYGADTELSVVNDELARL
jgi:hypothetical protein